MTFLPYGLHCIDDDDIHAVNEVLRSSYLTTGPKIKEFEDALCLYLGAKYCVVVDSGTAALDVAVNALELEQGSEVITTPMTFVASANAILYNNLVPVFVDIDPITHNINPRKIEQKITAKTKALLFVDLKGNPAEIDSLNNIARKYGLRLIEDACQAFSAEYTEKKIGCGDFAQLTTFSFHPVKHICTGEGGAITTADGQLYQRLLKLRNHGIARNILAQSRKEATYLFDMDCLGRNYRLPDINCALGLSQLKKSDDFLRKRETIAEKYHQAFKKIPEITLPQLTKGARSSWHLFVVLLAKQIDRDAFFAHMRSKEIGVNVHHIPVYHHSYYAQFALNPKDFPVTEDYFQRAITLPLYPAMADKDVERVIRETIATIQMLRKSTV